MNRKDARALLARLLPLVEKESGFLTPFPVMTLSAFDVFDAIRELSDPPISEEEFNTIADEIEGKVSQ